MQIKYVFRMLAFAVVLFLIFFFIVNVVEYANQPSTPTTLKKVDDTQIRLFSHKGHDYIVNIRGGIIHDEACE